MILADDFSENMHDLIAAALGLDFDDIGIVKH